MGSALVKGWQPFYDLTVMDPTYPDCLRHPDELPTGYQPDAIVLAVKPQIIDTIMPLYSPLFDAPNHLWISVAAGVPFAFFRQFLYHAPIVRAMPNLAVQFGEGITGLISTQGSLPLVETLFRPLGKTVWVEEEQQLDAVTALSGSGPAYFYAMVEALAQAGEILGLPFETAMTLARQTAIGAGVTLQNTTESASALRQQVTSPQGTTAAALELLNNPQVGLLPLVKKATDSAYQRAQRLGHDYLKKTSVKKEVL